MALRLRRKRKGEGLFASICRGAVAGAVGTAAMTLSSTLESKLRGRGSSDAPAEAAGKVMGVEPKGEEEKERFSNLVHWGYGTGWGTARGVLDYLGLDGPKATAAHFGAVWGTATIMLPALDVAPPAWEWGGKEIGIDALHHGVYAAATGAAYGLIDGAKTRAPAPLDRVEEALSS